MAKQDAPPPPIVTPAAIGAAGMASALASILTSSVGVAGTLLGAAATSMIITGGSAILRSYMEGAGGKLKTGFSSLRPGFGRSRKVGAPPPVRADLRGNAAGRLGSAFGWFAQLPSRARRPVLIKGLIAAGVAFVLAMGVVTAGESVIGNSLSCGLWSKCPEGRESGIHWGGGEGQGASKTFSLGRGNAAGSGGTQGADPANPADPDGVVVPGQQNTPSAGGGSGGSSGGQSGGQSGGGTQTPAVTPEPGETPTEEPAGETPVAPAPEEPVAEDPAAQPVAPAPTE